MGAEPMKNLSTCSSGTLLEMFDYFCSRMAFDRSPMDGTSIQCMNRLFIELRKQEEVIGL